MSPIYIYPPLPAVFISIYVYPVYCILYFPLLSISSSPGCVYLYLCISYIYCILYILLFSISFYPGCIYLCISCLYCILYILLSQLYLSVFMYILFILYSVYPPSQYIRLCWLYLSVFMYTLYILYPVVVYIPHLSISSSHGCIYLCLCIPCIVSCSVYPPLPGVLICFNIYTLYILYVL